MKYQVITVGGAMEDISFYTDEGVVINNAKDLLKQRLVGFEYGAKIGINKTNSTFGGGAANVSVALQKLGLDTAVVANVGSDERGDKIIADLRKQGVKTKYINQAKDLMTGFSFIIINKNADRLIFSNRGANSNLLLSYWQQRVLRKTDWVYITSLSGPWQENLSKIFAVKSAKKMWNPGHEQLRAGFEKIKLFVSQTDIFCVNKDEALEFVMSIKNYASRSRAWLNNTKNLLLAIKAQGPKVVLITDGPYGADVYDGRRFYHHDIVHHGPVLDTTGVGDAFGSAFLAGWELYDGDIKRSMLLGMHNAASTITQLGAQNGLLTKKDLIRLKLDKPKEKKAKPIKKIKKVKSIKKNIKPTKIKKVIKKPKTKKK